MRAWLRQHRQALRLALRRLAGGGALSALVIGIALALPAGGYALLDSLAGLATRASFDPQITVFLKSDLKRPEAQALERPLRADRRVAKLRFVSREQALKDLNAVQGLSDVTAALGQNPLPDAYVVTAREGNLDSLVADLAKLPGVAHVQADSAWARRLAALAEVGRLGLWLLACLLGLGLVAVTFNTIRLQILTQREEIEVSKLIGATDSFIRRPFYYLGLLQGMAGGLIALLLVSMALALLNREVRVLAESFDSAFRLSYLPLGDSLGIIALAGLLGWLGAHLSVSKHLREID
jgi:cell division transport system permease protein